MMQLEQVELGPISLSCGLIKCFGNYIDMSDWELNLSSRSTTSQRWSIGLGCGYCGAILVQ